MDALYNTLLAILLWIVAPNAVPFSKGNIVEFRNAMVCRDEDTLVGLVRTYEVSFAKGYELGQKLETQNLNSRGEGDCAHGLIEVAILEHLGEGSIAVPDPKLDKLHISLYRVVSSTGLVFALAHFKGDGRLVGN